MKKLILTSIILSASTIAYAGWDNRVSDHNLNTQAKLEAASIKSLNYYDYWTTTLSPYRQVWKRGVKKGKLKKKIPYDFFHTAVDGSPFCRTDYKQIDMSRSGKAKYYIARYSKLGFTKRLHAVIPKEDTYKFNSPKRNLQILDNIISKCGIPYDAVMSEVGLK